MNIIFSINGGIGKCIMATAVCSAIKKKYPNSNLIVVSGYPDVFINNPNVYRNYAFGNTSYFYDEYVRDKEVKVFVNDPYLTTDYVKQDTHLIKLWCEMFDISYNEEKPEIHLTAREIKFFSSKFVEDRPIMVLQANGGSGSELKYSWARDIPYDLCQKVIDTFANEYAIYVIGREDQAKYNNTKHATASFREICVLMGLSSKRLLIDSFGQHLAMALNLPSVVCWIANKPQVFGYDIHTNVVSNPFTIKPETRNSFLNEFNIQGDLIEFPYNGEHEIFSFDTIVGAIKGEKPEEKD
jgi:hypothetical protein